MISCKKCGAIIPDNLDACLICGMKSGVAPPQPPEYVTAPIPSPVLRSAAKQHPKTMMRFLSIMGVLIVLAAAAVFASQVLPHYFGSSGMSRAKNAIIYTSADGSLKFMSPTMNEPEILDQAAGKSGAIGTEASPNGKYIAYNLGGSNGGLYLRDCSARITEADDTRISPDVKSFFFTGDSTHIIYLTRDGKLYANNFTQSYLLDENVSGIVDCKDGKILYSGYSDASASALYVAEYLPGAPNKSTVAEDVGVLIDYSPAFDRFIFTVKQDVGGTAVNDVAAVDLKQNTRQTLATGAEKVIAADAKSFTALYQTAYNNPLHYDNIISDDLAREDSKIDEPDLDDYPLLKEFYEKYGEDAEYEGSKEFEDIAEEDAKFDLAIADYNKSRENEKLRLKILSEIDEFTLEHPTLYDLYLCRDGNVSRISESSYSHFDDAKLDVVNGVISWRETNFTLLEKILFSRFSPEENVSSILSEKLSDKLYIQGFGKSSTQIKIGENEQSYTCGGWQLTSKADGVYFAMGEGTPPVSKRNSSPATDYIPLDCTLYYYYTGSNTDIYGRIFTKDINVSAVGEMLDGDKLLYYKDVSGDIGNLYMLSDTEADSAGRRIGENVSLSGEYFKLENSGKTLLFCERFNSGTKSGNLFMYTKQNRQLATEVRSVFYRNDSLVYFTRNPQNGKADLYSFGLDGLVLVDTGVVSVPENNPFPRFQPLS